MSILLSASTMLPKKEEANNDEELKNYISKLNYTKVDFIHCDIADGKFVKNKTFDSRIVSEIKKATNKKIDVHLMINRPSLKIKKYIKAGAEIIFLHFESYKKGTKLIKDLEKIKRKGIKCGLAFSPTTEISNIFPLLHFIDAVLVMSVVPGYSGQKFLPETYARIDAINKYTKEENLNLFIEIDGGVTLEILPKLIEKKVDMVVMGSFLYSAQNLEERVEQIKALK